MTDRDRARLARLLGMLGSEFEGERENASRLIEAFRERHGLTWEQMLALPRLTPEPPPRDAAKEAAEAKARADAEAHRAAKAKADAKAEAERHQWKEIARRAAEAGDKEAQHAAYRAAARDRIREEEERRARAAPPPPPKPEPPPRHTQWTTSPPPPPPPRPWVWRPVPRLEIQIVPMMAFCALIGFWILSIARALAGF